VQRKRKPDSSVSPSFVLRVRINDKERFPVMTKIAGLAIIDQSIQIDVDERSQGERDVDHRLTDGRIGWCYVRAALEASRFPEPIAKSQAAPLTAERKLKKQDPWQVGPVETCLANPTESALWACHSPYGMRNRQPPPSRLSTLCGSTEGTLRRSCPASFNRFQGLDVHRL
jgi:hypothetical protein